MQHRRIDDTPLEVSSGVAGLLTEPRAARDRLPAGDRMRENQWDAGYDRPALIRSVPGDRVGALSHPVVSSLTVGLNGPVEV